MEKPMSKLILKKAEELPVLPPKILIYGQTGAGKSTLAAEMACGIRAITKSDKPVFIQDTEERVQAIVANVYKPQGIPVEVAQTRSYDHTRQLIKMAEKDASCLIIDQGSHLWKDLFVGYQNSKRRKWLKPNEWGEVIGMWTDLLDDFLYSSVPAILVSRAKNALKEVIDEEKSEQTGKTETTLMNQGFEAALQGETAYEAYFMVLLTRENNPEFMPTSKSEKRRQRFSRVATVTKDNFAAVDNKTIINPSFKDFKLHFQKMGIGPDAKMAGERKPVHTDPEKFKDPHAGAAYKKAEVMDKIKRTFGMMFPSRSEKDKAKVTRIMSAMSGAESLKTWAGLDVSILEWYLKGLKYMKTKKDAGDFPEQDKEVEAWTAKAMRELKEQEDAVRTGESIQAALDASEDDDSLPWDKDNNKDSDKDNSKRKKSEDAPPIADTEAPLEELQDEVETDDNDNWSLLD
jgi:hypothetical protein